MRDITDFLIIAFITGVVVVFSIVQARKEESSTEGFSEAMGPERVRKAG